MKLLIAIVNKEEYVERILSLLVESGTSGATILDSEGLSHFLAYEVPIFAGLKNLVGKSKSASRTILAVLEDDDIFIRFKELLVEEDIDFSRPGLGVIVTLPVADVIKPSK